MNIIFNSCIFINTISSHQATHEYEILTMIETGRTEYHQSWRTRLLADWSLGACQTHISTYVKKTQFKKSLGKECFRYQQGYWCEQACRDNRKSEKDNRHEAEWPAIGPAISPYAPAWNATVCIISYHGCITTHFWLHVILLKHNFFREKAETSSGRELPHQKKKHRVSSPKGKSFAQQTRGWT